MRSSHAIFESLNGLAESAEVVRTRLIGGKVTLLHRRCAALSAWPTAFPTERLAALHEQRHGIGRAHRVNEEPFPEWVPADVMQARAFLLLRVRRDG